MIIAFSGTDGAGKSTQIDLVSNYFKENGTKNKTVWARGGYTPGFCFFKKILRFLLLKKTSSAGDNTTRTKFFKNKGITKIWLLISILDLFLFYGLYVRVLNIFGYLVICDRYVEDTEIDFKRNFSDLFDPNSSLWRLLIWSLPIPTLSLLLCVPVEVSLIRSKLKREPFPDTPETLSYRLKIYLDEAIFPLSRYCKIDCQKSVGEVQAEIRLSFEQLN